MPRYRIQWDIGYGHNEDVVEADSHDEAVEFAYEAAREDFEAQASYGAFLIGDEEE